MATTYYTSTTPLEPAMMPASIQQSVTLASSTVGILAVLLANLDPAFLTALMATAEGQALRHHCADFLVRTGQSNVINTATGSVVTAVLDGPVMPAPFAPITKQAPSPTTSNAASADAADSWPGRADAVKALQAALDRRLATTRADNALASHSAPVVTPPASPTMDPCMVPLPASPDMSAFPVDELANMSSLALDAAEIAFSASSSSSVAGVSAAEDHLPPIVCASDAQATLIEQTSGIAAPQPSQEVQIASLVVINEAADTITTSASSTDESPQLLSSASKLSNAAFMAALDSVGLFSTASGGSWADEMDEEDQATASIADTAGLIAVVEPEMNATTADAALTESPEWPINDAAPSSMVTVDAPALAFRIAKPRTRASSWSTSITAVSPEIALSPGDPSALAILQHLDLAFVGSTGRALAPKDAEQPATASEATPASIAEPTSPPLECSPSGVPAPAPSLTAPATKTRRSAPLPELTDTEDWTFYEYFPGGVPAGKEGELDPAEADPVGKALPGAAPADFKKKKRSHQSRRASPRLTPDEAPSGAKEKKDNPSKLRQAFRKMKMEHLSSDANVEFDITAAIKRFLHWPESAPELSWPLVWPKEQYPGAVSAEVSDIVPLVPQVDEEPPSLAEDTVDGSEESGAAEQSDATQQSGEQAEILSESTALACPIDSFTINFTAADRQDQLPDHLRRNFEKPPASLSSQAQQPAPFVANDVVFPPLSALGFCASEIRAVPWPKSIFATAETKSVALSPALADWLPSSATSTFTAPELSSVDAKPVFDTAAFDVAAMQRSGLADLAKPAVNPSAAVSTTPTLQPAAALKAARPISSPSVITRTPAQSTVDADVVEDKSVQAGAKERNRVDPERQLWQPPKPRRVISQPAPLLPRPVFQHRDGNLPTETTSISAAKPQPGLIAMPNVPRMAISVESAALETPPQPSSRVETAAAPPSATLQPPKSPARKPGGSSLRV